MQRQDDRGGTEVSEASAEPETRSGDPRARITLNGEPRVVGPALSVAELVRSLGVDGRGIAVAINAEVVIRSRWAETLLQDGDRVEMLAAAPGG